MGTLIASMLEKHQREVFGLAVLLILWVGIVEPWMKTNTEIARYFAVATSSLEKANADALEAVKRLEQRERARP